jgi:hypothetical protein
VTQARQNGFKLICLHRVVGAAGQCAAPDNQSSCSPALRGVRVQEDRLSVLFPPCRNLIENQQNGLFKSETRSTKHETNSNTKNTNDKNLGPVRQPPKRFNLIACYY